MVGVTGTGEGFYWITNRLPASTWTPWAHDAVYAGIAALMIAAGLVALRRERATK